jgi:KipI family sensor histidine kinase inhibitor
MPAADAPLEIAWSGERAILVRVGREPGPAATARVRAVADALDRAAPPAVQEIVPAYTSVLVLLDPFAPAPFDPTAVRRKVGRIARAALADARGGPDEAQGRLWRVPVRYGGEDGPDLAGVAAWARLSPEAVVAIHTGRDYDVLAVGFRPGYPFLGFVDERIAAPRLDVHRPRVAAGSVGIAGRQTGVYSRASSGGWQIVGRTDFPLFDPGRADAAAACTLAVGDRVRFVAEGSGGR